MDRKTTGIIATLVASIFCGLPGLICLCFSASLAIMSQDPGWLSQSSGDLPARTDLTLGLLGSCLGIFLILIPTSIAAIYFRRRKPNPVLAIDEPLPPPS